MPIQVQGPDGSTVEFPDGTPQATMEAALQAHYGKPQAAPQQPAATPRNGLVNAADAFQHHVMSPLHGAAQFVEHGVNAAANRLLPQPEQTMSGLVTGHAPQAGGLAGIRQYINRTVAADDAALASREQAYQQRTPDGAGATMGAVAGEVAPFLVSGPARALGYLGDRAASLLPEGAALTRKLVSFGTQGALLGGTQPVTDGNYAQQKALQVAGGAATGIALPVGVAAVRGVGRLAAPIVAPQRVANAQLARLFGADAGTLDKLTNAQQFVPGEQVTAARAIQTPQAVMVEKALRNRPDMRAQFANVDNANNAARLDVVRGHAGDDAQMAAAKAALRDGPGQFWLDNLTRGSEDGRFSRTQKHLTDALGAREIPMPEYHILDKARLIAGQVQRGTIDALTGENMIRELQPKTAYGKQVLSQAHGILNQGMMDPSPFITHLQGLVKSTNPQVSSAAEQQLAAIAKNQTDSTGWVHASVLDGLRQNVGKLLGNPLTGAVDAATKAEYVPFQNKVVRALDRTVPGYSDNLAAYRAGKQPINTMEASQRILAPVDSGGLNSAGDATLTLARLNSGLNKADKSRYGLSPTARKDMEGVRQSLQRDSVSNSITAPGSDTAYNLAAEGWLAQQLYGPTMQGPTGKTRGLAALLGAVAGSHAGVPGGEFAGGLGGLYINKAAEAINSRIAQRVGKGAADSQEAARMIKQFMATQSPESGSKLLQRYPQWAALLSR